MNSKKKIVILSICLSLVIIIGVSYAYFVATITGQENSSTLVLNSGTLNINVNVGNRYVYALDIADVLEYFNNEVFTKEQLNTLFFNQETKYSAKLIGEWYYIWLRSAYSINSNNAWGIDSRYGRLDRSGSYYTIALAFARLCN